MRFHAMFEKHNAIMLLIEPATGEILDANVAAQQFYGYSASRLRTMNISDINTLPPEEIVKERQNALRENKNYFIFTHRLANGESRTVEVHSSPIISGEKTTLFSIVHDITDRKKVELALRRSEAKYRTLHESMRDAFASIDMSGHFLEFNQTYQEMIGYSAEELSTLTYLEVTPEKWHPLEARIIQEQILERGYSDVYEKEYRRKNGTIFPVELRAFLIQDDAGHPESMWAIVRDITGRKHAEEALQRSLEEKETLLREIHHRVKNNLAAIISLLELQRDRVTDSPSLLLLKDLGSRIKSMALVHEMLYQSDNLSRIDFHDYLQALVRYLCSSFDPQGAIRLTAVATDIWMPLDAAIPCGLIVNELVVNALKYAFPVDRRSANHPPCDISITLTWENMQYTLMVTDNGVGLPADLDWKTTRTLGLRLVRMLGQHQLQGTLALGRTVGTQFILRFGANPQWNRSIHVQ